jgi:hypothetical protein
VGEYTLIEQLRGMAAIAETFEGLHPQLEDADLRVQVPSLDVSVLVVEGRYEAAVAGGRRWPRSGSNSCPPPARGTSSWRTRAKPVQRQ